MDSLTKTPTSVPYTHLDVYKRQFPDDAGAADFIEAELHQFPGNAVLVLPGFDMNLGHGSLPWGT